MNVPALYMGTDDPSPKLGRDGDEYLQTRPKVRWVKRDGEWVRA